jgi:hypothetical protein
MWAPGFQSHVGESKYIRQATQNTASRMRSVTSLHPHRPEEGNFCVTSMSFHEKHLDTLDSYTATEAAYKGNRHPGYIHTSTYFSDECPKMCEYLQEEKKRNLGDMGRWEEGFGKWEDHQRDCFPGWGGKITLFDSEPLLKIIFSAWLRRRRRGSFNILD